MLNYKYKIFISATEQSGDNIGFNIINRILKNNKNVIFDGLGGSKMKPLMRNQFYNLNDFNKMGIIEIFFSIPKFIRMINYLLTKIKYNNYDLIVTIDSPDFHYPLVKKIKKNVSNIKFIQIVAPSVWAWRPNRAYKFAKIFDELLVLYKFEIKYFSKFNLKTTFIGHPIYYISNVKTPTNCKYIAFLPGSRISEVKNLLPYFELAYECLLKKSPSINIIIPTLPHLKKYVEEFVSNWKINVIVTENLFEIEKFYTMTTHALVCSGTASLEIATREIPQLVIYKFNYVTELIAKLFVKIKFANILNIIENKEIIPEITNSNLNPKIFIKSFNQLIESEKDNTIQIMKVKKALHSLKTSQSPYSKASNIILSYLI